MQNSEIAEILSRLADLLELDGAGEYRVRAYRGAAHSITEYHKELARMVADGEDVSVVPGVGKSIAGKIEEIVRTGGLAQLKELESRYPPRLVELERIAGLGAKRVGAIYRALGTATLEELARAAREGKIRKLPGFGARTEQNILAAISRLTADEAKGGEQA